MVVCTQFLQSFPVTDFVCFPRYCVPFASIKSSLSSTPFSEKFVPPAVSNSSPPNLLVLNILKDEDEDEVETANALPPTHKAPMATTNFFVAFVFVFKVLFVERNISNSSSGDGTTPPGFDSRSSSRWYCCFLRSEEVSSLNIILRLRVFYVFAR